MNKILNIVILSLFLIGCSENKSESNRKKSKIKLSCKIEKVHVIKKFDGTIVNTWIDEKYIKDNLSEVAKPIILEIFDKDSLAMWSDQKPVLMQSHDAKGFTYLNISTSQKKGFIHLHYQSFNYENLEFRSESSMMIKDDDTQYDYGFGNKADISSIGYGLCKKIK